MYDDEMPCAREPHPGPQLGRLSEALLEQSARIFRALGEPGRLAVLLCLHQREVCVSELAEILGEQLSTISQRLRVLYAEGLVARRRDGKHIYYTCADEHVTVLLDNAIQHGIELAERSVLGAGDTASAWEGRT